MIINAKAEGIREVASVTAPVIDEMAAMAQ